MDSVIDCTKCSLRANCGQVVWGRSSPGTWLMLVGESPDKESDLMGEPFAGRPGQLLRKLLGQAGFSESEYALTYAVKCMPTKKNEPTKEQINECRGWLWQEIRTVAPKVIVTLGAMPTSLLLRLPKSLTLSEHVGQFKSVGWFSGAIAPWYGPNYILQRGKKLDTETVTFFKSIKEKYVPNL